MTSRWEGFGLVLVEAMDFGLPILAFSRTGSNEVIANGKHGVLVENGDVSELTNQLTMLINDVEKRSNINNYHYKELKISN